MKYCKLVVALLVSVSVATAAAGSWEDGYRLVHFVLAGKDHPELLAEAIGNSLPLTYNEVLQDALARMIEKHMIRSFEALFLRIVYERGFDRSASKSLLLGAALQHHHLEIADIILERTFVFFPDFADWGKCCLGQPESSNPERLAELKGLISRHPEMAYDLAPSPNRIQAARVAAEAIFLIDIAQHCEEERSKLGTQPNACFNPSVSLYDVVLRSALDDSDMAEVARHLLELGAMSCEQLTILFMNVHPDFGQSYQLLLNWTVDDIKVPEEEANINIGDIN